MTKFDAYRMMRSLVEAVLQKGAFRTVDDVKKADEALNMLKPEGFDADERKAVAAASAGGNNGMQPTKPVRNKL
jgi:hypothetical protein